MASACDCPPALRHRVTFEKQTRVDDGGGGWTETWATDRKCWAAVEPLKGGEKWQAMQTQHPVTHKITVRWSSAVAALLRDADMDRRRINFKTRIMRLVSIINVEERDRYLEIMVREGAAV